MSSDVVLGSALRTNLLSLQRTQSSIDKVQNILATGLKVSSALDNPQSFFAAQGLQNRASDLTRLLDGIGQSVSTIKAADTGATAVGKLVDQAESIISSAQEAITEGAGEAMIKGNVDLSGVTDLTTVSNIANGDEIVISYLDDDGTSIRTESIAIATGDSIDQLIAKINDVGGTQAGGYDAGEVIEASLSDEGFLQIRSKTGNAFTVNFDSDGAAAFVAADQALGTALGFGGIAQRTDSGGASATDGNYEVTALNTTKLTSGVFYDDTDGIADASDALTSVVDTLGGSTVRFDDGDNASAGENSTLRFTINGTTNIDITLENTTIQGLVDGINDAAANTGLVRASYDSVTGQFSIEATSSTVQTIGTSIRNSATDTAANKADFDFGLAASLNTTAAASTGDGETYVLASAAGTLARLEDDYNSVRQQIDQLVSDSGYRGVNLLEGDELVTYFNEDRTSSLTTSGASLTAAGLGLSEANFTADTLGAFTSQVLAAKEVVRDFGSAIANSLSIVQTREDFTKSIVQELTAGAEKLTVADQNEEGAKLLALQTRQQLGVTSLSLAVQSQQSVLRLF